MARKKQYTVKKIVKALREASGTVLLAADKLGCAPSTIYRRAKESVTVRQAMEEARGNTYAEAQGRLIAMMRDREHKNHKWAVERILKTYGDTVDDGLEWSDKQRHEHSGPDGGPQEHTHQWGPPRTNIDDNTDE